MLRCFSSSRRAFHDSHSRVLTRQHAERTRSPAAAQIARPWDTLPSSGKWRSRSRGENPSHSCLFSNRGLMEKHYSETIVKIKVTAFYMRGRNVVGLANNNPVQYTQYTPSIKDMCSQIIHYEINYMTATRAQVC